MSFEGHPGRYIPDYSRLQAAKAVRISRVLAGTVGHRAIYVDGVYYDIVCGDKDTVVKETEAQVRELQALDSGRHVEAMELDNEGLRKIYNDSLSEISAGFDAGYF